MRVTGVDACRRGWVAVSLEVPGPGPSSRAGPGPGPALAAVRVHATLTGLLGPDADPAAKTGPAR